MNVAIASLLVAGLMPIVCAGIAKAGKKNYDNHNPREWLAQQTGYRAREPPTGSENGYLLNSILFLNYDSCKKRQCIT